MLEPFISVYWDSQYMPMGLTQERLDVPPAWFAGHKQARGVLFSTSGDEPHVGIAGVTLHKTRPISIIEDTNRYLELVAAVRKVALVACLGR